MSRPSKRVRNHARQLGVPEDDLLIWLEEHAPQAGSWHAADFLSPELADRAQAALAPKDLTPAKAAAPLERRCAECLGLPAEPGVRLVEAGPGHVCEACGGSVNRREALAMLEAFRVRGARRLLVVGGGPGTAEELHGLLGDRIEVKIIDGEAHRNAPQADADLKWADVAVIWGSTILSHKVSKLYTDQRALYRDKLVTVPKRGVAALCRAAAEKVSS